MTETAERRLPTPAKYHHGKSPAAWAGIMLSFLGILVGGLGMVPPIGNPVNWTVVVIGAVIIVLGLAAAVVLRKLGLGNG